MLKKNYYTSLLTAFRVISAKLLWMLIVFLGITLISFCVIHLAPGSPTDLETTMNPLADSEAHKRLTEYYGLDKPLMEQYANWLKKLLQLDFGNSMSSDSRPVIEKIKEHLPLTLWLNVTSLFITLLIAIPLGVIAATKKGKLFDKLTTLFVFSGLAIPSFWLAILLMTKFSVELQWFPLSGIISLNHANMSFTNKVLDVASHLALPLFIITFGGLAGASRFMRSSMIEVLKQDYIVTARAKGLPERLIIFRHALRNSLLPVITLLGLSIPGLIGGSVIIESIFSLPGMGQLFYNAVMARDYPLIMGNLVIGAVLTLTGNTIADICYGLADPRIRKNAGSHEK